MQREGTVDPPPARLYHWKPGSRALAVGLPKPLASKDKPPIRDTDTTGSGIRLGRNISPVPIFLEKARSWHILSSKRSSLSEIFRHSHLTIWLRLCDWLRNALCPIHLW